MLQYLNILLNTLPVKVLNKTSFAFVTFLMLVTFSGLFTVPYFCRSFSINLSMGDNTCLR